MSAPQSGGGDLNAAFQAFSNEVFEATQRLLGAQHQLTQEIVGAAVTRTRQQTNKPWPTRPNPIFPRRTRPTKTSTTKNPVKRTWATRTS